MEEEEKKEEQKENIQKKPNFTEKIRENPWTVSTLILGILVAILLVTTFSGTLTGNAVSKDTATNNLIDYAKLQGIEVLVNKVTEESGLYSVDVDINGKATSLYLTKDGKNIVNGLIPITTSSSNTSTQVKEVPKTDKPSVELYVFTYCPYGLQMEKAIIPVVKLLGDKIDFKIRQIGAMHGEYEKIEAERQLCIEKNYPDKFLDYVLAFAEDTSIGSCSGDATCLVPKLNTLYTKFGIDASKINACMTSEGESLYNAEVSNSESKGVSGSPTLIINGVEAQTSSRSPEAVKGTICEAFTSVPTQCSQKLGTTSSSAGFGSGADSSASSASCG